MIDASIAHRFAGDNGIDIARCELDAIHPNGKRLRVILRIGAPYERNGSFWVRSELENLDQTDGPLAGADSLQALAFAFGFIARRLDLHRAKHGIRYCWPDSEELFPFEAYFGTLPVKAS